MHVGSAYAICSPHPILNELGGEYKPNRLQRRLYDHWLKVKDSLSQKPDVLCINGEGCDGPNVKQLGSQSWTTSVRNQLDDAEKLLRIFSWGRIVVSRGSGYHVQTQADNHDEDLAQRLNATTYSGYLELPDYDRHRNKTSRTDYFVNFKLNDRVFNVTHHIAFSRWESYKPTALVREMANLEYLRGRYWKGKDQPTFIVRSHVHYYVQVRFSSTCGFTTPSWKFPDAHLYRGGLSGTAPSIGAIEVIVEDNGKYEVNPILMDNDRYPKMSILEF